MTVIGTLGVHKLHAVRDRLQYRAPVANRWVAPRMAWQGHSRAALARRLRVTTTSVRKWLDNTGAELCAKDRFNDDGSQGRAELGPKADPNRGAVKGQAGPA